MTQEYIWVTHSYILFKFFWKSVWAYRLLLFVYRFICEHCPLTLTIQDNVGRTPLHYAATLNDNGETFGILEEYGADPHKEDEVKLRFYELNS